MGQDAGTLHEINVKNTYVHDVISIPIGQQAGIGRGGIVYAIRGNKKATNWEDITVEGNYVKNVTITVLTLFQHGEAQHSLMKVELLKVAVEHIEVKIL